MPDSTKVPALNFVSFDNSSFEVFFKENFPGLCAYCQYKYGFDLDEAKEAVHTGFIKLWESRNTISPELEVKAYLHTIIKNVCFDLLRHKKVKQNYEKVVLQKNVSTDGKSINEADFNQLNNDIDKAVAELPEQMRKVFELSRNEGLKYTEIAFKLTISVKTVETQMGRALVKLRQKLADYLPLYFVLILLSF